ncbi:MAG: hypothetical protein IKV85_01005 [Ruminococcus sp.]|nr:hypothetical protein [Ruminococcus sp.]
MNIRHFFDNADEKTIDRITEKYPPLSSADKERLYAMSKKKYNKEMTENKGNYIEISGVERYHKPLWHKVLSAVAVAAVVLGGIGGGAALIRRNNDADILNNESSQLAEIDTAEIEDIAQQLTDEFFDLKNIISSRGAAYDENDILTYKIGIFDDTLENPEVYDRTFYKVTDERFKCSQDIYDALRSITTMYYLPEESYVNADIPWIVYSVPAAADYVSVPFYGYLGKDVSVFENGSSVDRSLFANKMFNESYEPVPFDLEDDNDWETPYCIWVSDYIEHSGSLYMISPDYQFDPVGIVYDYNEKIEITEVAENSFTAVRYADISQNKNIIKRAEFKFLYMNGEWLIDKFSESVLDKEEIGSEETDFTAIAQQLTDKVLEFEKILLDADIEYDENDSISFYRYDSFDPDAEDEEVRYCRVTDERFNSCQDIYTFIRSFTSFEYNPQDDYRDGMWIDESGVVSWLGNDLSEYEIGARIERGEEWLTHYTTYNGQLYVQPLNTHDYVSREYTSDVSVGVTGEDRFTATRSYTEHYTEDITSERCFDFVLEAGKWKIDKVYFSDEEDENESEDEYEYLDIAGDLTDRFFYMIDVLGAYNVSYDENDFITYNCYSVSNPATLSEKYGVDLSGAEEKTDFLYTRKLYKVTDDRFKSCQDIYNALRELTSSSLLPEKNYENADLPINGNELVTTPIAILGTDVSMYESGSNIYDSYFSDFENRKFDMQDSDNWEAALSAFGSHYVEYNGNLYIIGDMGYSDMPDVHVNLQNVEENRFSVTRKHIISYEDETERIESYNFDFVFENGEWKIDNVERVVSDEEAIGNAIASYVDTLIRSDTDKYGNIYENPDVFDFGFEIVGYNGENNCTARVILTDYDYVDVIELTAEIDIKEQKVINAEIIELQ